MFERQVYMAKARIAVLVSGGGTNLQALIDAQGCVINSGSIELVISNNPNAYALTKQSEPIKPVII